MKTVTKLTLVFAVVIAFQSAFAQHGTWKELQVFHGVMAKTFHPSEEGDLKPVKANSADLLAKAKSWQASAIPADFKPEQTKKILGDLVIKCEELNKAVKAEANDEDLKKLIGQAHDIFHQLVEKCQKPEGEK